MKAIIAMLLSLFLYTSTYAQDPQLIENEWYLQKIVIDEIDYFSPFTWFYGQVNFQSDFFEVYHQYCGDGGYDAILYENSDVFHLDNNSIWLIGFCAYPPLINFMGVHYSIYYYYLNGQFTHNPFSYTIITNGDGSETLTITNGEGNQAIYGNELLSIPEFSNQAISIYPNPVINILNIESDPSVEIQSLTVYNLLGESILEKNGDLNQFDVSSLDSGVYFLKFETAQGALTKKIIKN